MSKPQVLIALGETYEAMQTPQPALDAFSQAYEMIRSSDDHARKLVCLREIARLRMGMGQQREAIMALQQAIDLAHVLEMPEEQLLRDTLAEWKQQTP